MSNVLGRVCMACGQERKVKDKIAYHPETFEPYCSTPYICNDEHPNSPKNLMANRTKYPNTYGQTILLPYEEAKEQYHKWLEANHPHPEKVAKIRKMVENPMTFRIGSPELAEFLLNLQEEMGFTSMSDTLKLCITRMQEEHGGYHQKIEKWKKEDKEEKNLQEVVASPVIERDPITNPTPADEWSF